MVEIVELVALRAELAHCRTQGTPQLNKDIQAFADLIVTAETSLKKSDMFTAWAFVADTQEAQTAFHALAVAALAAGD
jgi:hypothetical protein